MTSIRLVKAHLKKEKATAAGASYEYWFGNNADKHGYTAAQKYDIINRVTLAKNAHTHMLKNYIIYINHPLARNDALNNTNYQRHAYGNKRQTDHQTRTNGTQ
eukprot:16435868-Heterocapsa_arctica.AAC.1